MPVPDFSVGEVFTAAAADSIGLWKITNCTATVAGAGATVAVTDGNVTITGNATSLTISSAFSDNFDNYKVIWSGGSMSASTNISLQMGTTNANYRGNLIYGLYNNATPQGVADNNAASFTHVGGGDSTTLAVNLDILSPKLAENTRVFGANVSYGFVNGSYRGYLADTTAYTAFTLFPASGTFTGGILRVYGYR